MNPDATCGLIRAERRPINAFELADLERRREAAETAALLQQRSLRGRVAKTLVLGGVIYCAMWTAVLVTGGDGLTKPFVSTIAGASVAIGVSTWEMRRSRRDVARVRTDWAGAIAGAKLHPVEQIDIAPLQAWYCDEGWIFDLGGGVAMFGEFDIAAGGARALLTWRRAWGCEAWIDQSGTEVTRQAMKFPELPNDHPLCESWGPAVFLLDSKDPGGSLLRFEGGNFPLGARE